MLSAEQIEVLKSGNLNADGNNWPPIISLPEAEDFSFKIGSAVLSPNFRDQLQTSIGERVAFLLKEYKADVIEVIGHTDAEPMGKSRSTNLDHLTLAFFKTEKNIILNASDNAGLGYARALSVSNELMKVPSLEGYTILPYSAAQMILPNDEMATGFEAVSSEERRRIEIRVRRKRNEKN